MTYDASFVTQSLTSCVTHRSSNSSSNHKTARGGRNRKTYKIEFEEKCCSEVLLSKTSSKTSDLMMAKPCFDTNSVNSQSVTNNKILNSHFITYLFEYLINQSDTLITVYKITLKKKHIWLAPTQHTQKT